jgi:hypothetical protein
MATKNVVTGDQYRSIDRKMTEIKRQLTQENGYPFDLDKLTAALQAVSEGRFEQVLGPQVQTSATPTQAHGVINLEADPFVPNGWAVEEHKMGGLFDFGKSKIELFRTKKQQCGYVVGYNLREELAREPVLNANVLDYVIEHPEFIPEDWKGKYVFFWGTVYICSLGRQCVRYLHWSNNRWSWHYRLLSTDWDNFRLAACAQPAA